MKRIRKSLLVQISAVLVAVREIGTAAAFLVPTTPSTSLLVTTRNDQNSIRYQRSSNNLLLLATEDDDSSSEPSSGNDDAKNEKKKTDSQDDDSDIASSRRSLSDEEIMDVLDPKESFFPPPIETLKDQAKQKGSKRNRFKEALPFKGDSLDATILSTAVPSMINLGVVPIVNAVDTFWVGRLSIALALAGQAAANQASFTLFFLISFLPNITAPLVASAVASGNKEDAQDRICESLFICNLLGGLGTLALVLFPRQILAALVLPSGAPAMDFAAPYLRWRALSMVPSLIAATGFAAYRGMLNTVTPLKVSLVTNAINLVLDPLCIFTARMGFIGAAAATAASELVGGMIYLRLLFRRKLSRWSKILKPPSFKSLVPLLQGGAAMLARQLALNVGFLAATRRAQIMDPSGVSGAAYGITMQIYSVGVIVLVAVQGTAAALIPSSLAQSGEKEATRTADRLFGWSSLFGCLLGVAQYLLLPLLVPLFSTLPAVQEAVRKPALIASLIHAVNGPVFAGEGYLMGTGQYRDLALITAAGISGMVGCFYSPLGKRLDGIMWSILLCNVFQSIGVVTHFLKVGPLARDSLGLLKKKMKGPEQEGKT
jgi:putative MATE family efflux protein